MKVKVIKIDKDYLDETWCEAFIGHIFEAYDHHGKNYSLKITESLREEISRKLGIDIGIQHVLYAKDCCKIFFYTKEDIEKILEETKF